MKNNDLQFFDTKSYLENNSIPFKSSGSNVTTGWIEVNCPFCGDDPSAHLGINLSSNLFSCWRCAEKGSIIKYVQAIDDCSYGEALDIIKTYQKYTLPIEEEKVVKIQTEIKLPEEIDWAYKDQMIKYLVSRGYSPSIIQKYSLYPCGNFGNFKFKIIIPVFEDKKLITFTSRSYIKGVENSKKHFKDVDIKDYLYNIDNYTGGTMFVVEGPPGCWRIGDNSICTFGIKFTDVQVQKIVQKQPDKVIIAFDNEPQALEQAEKLKNKLNIFIPEVLVVELPIERDSGDLLDSEVQELRNL